MTDIHDPTTDGTRTRLDRFDDALTAIGHRPSGRDRSWIIGGLSTMALGLVVTVIAYGTSTAMSDQRDLQSAIILALVGLALVVVGAAVFATRSLTQFLRFWMLRLLLDRDDRESGN